MADLTYNQLYAAYVDVHDEYRGLQIELEALKQSALAAITACQENDTARAVSILTRGLLDTSGGYPAPGEGTAIEQILNGEFNDDTAWTMDTGAITISAGEAIFTGLASGAYMRQAVNLLANTTYQFSFDLTDCTAGTIQFSLDNGFEGLMRNVPGYYEVRYTMGPVGATEIRWGRGYASYIPDDFTGRIDNCSIIGPIAVPT